MQINELELKRILEIAFDAGWYGIQDQRESVIENLLKGVKEQQPQCSTAAPTAVVSTGSWGNVVATGNYIWGSTSTEASTSANIYNSRPSSIVIDSGTMPSITVPINNALSVTPTYILGESRVTYETTASPPSPTNPVSNQPFLVGEYRFAFPIDVADLNAQEGSLVFEFRDGTRADIAFELFNHHVTPPFTIGDTEELDYKEASFIDVLSINNIDVPVEAALYVGASPQLLVRLIYPISLLQPIGTPEGMRHSAAFCMLRSSTYGTQYRGIEVY